MLRLRAHASDARDHRTPQEAARSAVADRWMTVIVSCKLLCVPLLSHHRIISWSCGSSARKSSPLHADERPCSRAGLKVVVERGGWCARPSCSFCKRPAKRQAAGARTLAARPLHSPRRPAAWLPASAGGTRLGEQSPPLSTSLQLTPRPRASAQLPPNARFDERGSDRRCAPALGHLIRRLTRSHELYGGRTIAYSLL